jgi:hypothetical protein
MYLQRFFAPFGFSSIPVVHRKTLPLSPLLPLQFVNSRMLPRSPLRPVRPVHTSTSTSTSADASVIATAQSIRKGTQRSDKTALLKFRKSYDYTSCES